MEPNDILMVEDDQSIAAFVSAVLEANGYRLRLASTGAEALAALAEAVPAVTLLDLGLPDLDGMEVLRALRRKSQAPVIVLSARGEEADKVTALDEGADDYIMKPFGTSELLARIRAAIRHGRPADRGDCYRSGGLLIDFERRRVELDGEEVHLTQNEYKIVTLLARSAGRVLTYDAIIREIWGPFNAGDNKILRVNMANIRRKFEKNPAQPRYFFTEVGLGYRMAEQEETDRAGGGCLRRSGGSMVQTSTAEDT